METMMNLIISDDRVAPRSDLNPSQCVAMDFIVLQNTTPTSKEVHSPLESTVYLIVLECGVALSCDPHTSVCIGIDLVLNELPSSLGNNIK